MQPKPHAGSAPKKQPHKKSKIRSSFMKPLLAALLIGSLLVGVGSFFNGAFFLSESSNDKLTHDITQERYNTFNALGKLPLNEVSRSELAHALASMNLSPEQRTALEDKLSGISPDQPLQQPDLATTPKNEAAAKPDDTAQSPYIPLFNSNDARLVWITLWDTNAQDGDVVKVDSLGYSRTVVLRHEPITFAIPAPEDGTINITGVHDADHYGITAGIGSTGMQLPFPIINQGQMFKVKINTL